MKHFNHNALGKKGLIVEVINNDINLAIKHLKHRTLCEGLMADMRRLEYYEKPSDRKRKEQRIIAIRSKNNKRERDKMFNNEYCDSYEYYE